MWRVPSRYHCGKGIDRAGKPRYPSIVASPSADTDRVEAVLLSDRDIRAALIDGELAIEPHDDAMVQPSSIDVRLDGLFRVFNNSKYTHIDPKLPQEELTTLVEVSDDEAFILHPGEFVLGATLEKFTIPANLAGRLEGKSSLGRLGLLTHSTACLLYTSPSPRDRG